MTFASTDILDAKDLWLHFFNFKDTKPLNDNFALFDIVSKNFVVNSGSYFIFVMVSMLSGIGRKIIN